MVAFAHCCRRVFAVIAPPPADPTALWPELVACIVKTGVSLGGMAPLPQSALLALAALGFREGEAMDEASVNLRLRAQLAGLLQCLATDHVELRRWLVDSGWLQRDGYGRRYQRAPLPQLSEAQQQWVLALAERDADGWAAWAEAQRTARQAQRAERLQRWQSQGPRP